MNRVFVLHTYAYPDRFKVEVYADPEAAAAVAARSGYRRQDLGDGRIVFQAPDGQHRFSVIPCEVKR
jgi:hypothetical protein